MAGLAAKAMMGRNRGIDTGLTKGKFLHSHTPNFGARIWGLVRRSGSHGQDKSVL